MELIQQGFDIFLHLDAHLNELAGTLGPWLYAVLFAIVFCETGLVVTPILPGDSLLFAVGALAAAPGSPLSLPVLLVLMSIAAVIGDLVNYTLGYHIGPRVFRYEHSRLFNKKHLVRTQQFYEKYGAKTIVLARFVPIVRTFAPFVAGVGRMQYARFAIYNVAGGIAWVAIFLLGGYFLGSAPGVKQNFHYIILAILVISVLPMVIEFFLSRRRIAPAQPVPLEVE
jgi:membrane-associated protein